MRPGLSLQKLTTREPDLDQLEVAIASLRAVMTAEQLAEVAARAQRSGPGQPGPAAAGFRHRLTPRRAALHTSLYAALQAARTRARVAMAGPSLGS